MSRVSVHSCVCVHWHIVSFNVVIELFGGGKDCVHQPTCSEQGWRNWSPFWRCSRSSMAASSGKRQRSFFQLLQHSPLFLCNFLGSIRARTGSLCRAATFCTVIINVRRVSSFQGALAFFLNKHEDCAGQLQHVPNNMGMGRMGGGGGI